MYKFASFISNSHLVLVRKQISTGKCAALVVMRAPVRRYAMEHYKETCPTPPARAKSRKFLYGTLGTLLLAGAGVVYAKNSPNVRNWLDGNIPWASQFVGVCYQENETYYQFASNQLGKVSDAVHDFLFGKEGIEPMEFQQRVEQDLELDAKKGFAPKLYESMLVQTEKCEPASPPKTVVTKELVALEAEMHANTKEAMDTYKKALKLCTEYNKTLDKIIQAPLGATDKKLFVKLKTLRGERDEAIQKARSCSAKAKCAIQSLDRMMSNDEIQAPPENLTQTKRYTKSFTGDLNTMEDAVKEECFKYTIADKHWEKVQAAREQYKEELETLFPDNDLCDRPLKIKEEDTDLLLLHTMKQIQFYQNEIAEMQTIREHKLNRAIECMDEKMLIEAKVEDMVKKERLEKDLEFQKKALQMQAEAKKKLKEELRKQAEIQEDLTKNKLNKKEQEIMSKYHKQVSEQVEKERVQYKKELAAMAGKLQAIEQTLKQRAAQEQEMRRSQSMWAAAEALLATTRRPQPETLIQPEVQALEKAGEKDKLVQTVLKGISEEAKEDGIVTEKELRDRFDKLEKRASKVALIGREGASLPAYFLSWLQSKMIFTKLAEIPADELNNLPTDFTKLDTFDIIQRARYHMDHGDLQSALRYVNLLQGAPRAAAACWAESARRHLEVRQAAETVMAHASLSGMTDENKDKKKKK